jgi:hypothetical protein
MVVLKHTFRSTPFSCDIQTACQVGKNGFKPGPLPDLAAPRLDQGGISECTKGSLARLNAGEIFEAHKLLGLLLEVFTDFFA